MGSSSEDILGIALRLALVVGVPLAIVLALWYILSLGEGVLGPLAAALQWLAGLWSESPQWGPCFALSAVFSVQQWLTLPLRLLHTRVDRRTGRVRDTDREEIFKVISITACFLLDLVVLLLALEAIGGDRVDWITVNVLLPVASRLGVLGYAVLIAACYLTVVGAHVFVLDAVANRESAPRNSGRFSSDQLLDTLFYVLGDAAIHGAAILLLGLLTFGWWQGAFNPFAPTAMLCFAVVSMVSTWVVVSTSCVLNRCNDGWIQRLGQQLAQDPDPHRRLQAIEKLKNLGKWAKPVEDAIRGALNDKDSNVRQIAQDVVRRLK